jgi:MFS family permease
MVFNWQRTMRNREDVTPGAAGTHDEPLSANRDFRTFWLGMALSCLGSSFTVVALPLLVLESTGSVARMGMITAVRSAGGLVVSLFAGPLVDRMDRRRLMLWADIGRMAAYGAIPVGTWLLGPSTLFLAICVVIGEALTTIFSVTFNAAVANLVPASRLTEANSRLQATFATFYVIGPVLAGIFCTRFGAADAILVDAISFGVSAFAFTRLTLRYGARSSMARSRPESKRDELLAGIRFILRNPVIRASALLTVGVYFCGAATIDLFIYYLKHDLGRSDDSVGIVLGIAGIGAALGGLATPLLRRRFGFGPSFLASILVRAVVLLLAHWVTGLAAMVVLAVLFMLGEYLAMILWGTLRQEMTPDRLRGRVSAAASALSVAGPIGAAVLTGIAARHGTPAAFQVGGAIILVCFVAGVFSAARARDPVREREHEPPAGEA